MQQKFELLVDITNFRWSIVFWCFVHHLFLSLLYVIFFVLIILLSTNCVMLKVFCYFCVFDTTLGTLNTCFIKMIASILKYAIWIFFLSLLWFLFQYSLLNIEPIPYIQMICLFLSTLSKHFKLINVNIKIVTCFVLIKLSFILSEFIKYLFISFRINLGQHGRKYLERKILTEIKTVLRNQKPFF